MYSSHTRSAGDINSTNLLVELITAGIKCLCDSCKLSPRTLSLCSYIVIFFWSPEIMDCMLFIFENRVLPMR